MVPLDTGPAEPDTGRSTARVGAVVGPESSSSDGRSDRRGGSGGSGGSDGSGGTTGSPTGDVGGPDGEVGGGGELDRPDGDDGEPGGGGAVGRSEAVARVWSLILLPSGRRIGSLPRRGGDYSRRKLVVTVEVGQVTTMLSRPSSTSG
jgi:hypothetical protein